MNGVLLLLFKLLCFMFWLLGKGTEWQTPQIGVKQES